MATVYLYRNGPAVIKDLPLVCMQCGAVATRTHTTSYTDTIWRRQRIAKPLCEKHWQQACLKKVIRFGSSVFYFAFMLFIFSQDTLRQIVAPTILQLLLWWALAYMITLALISMIGSFVLKSPIRPLKITETVIELIGVAPQFVAALERDGEANREKFESEIGLPFGSSAPADDRIWPSGDDN